jgi:catechol 2,3-dioxygenase-like lactoylglutathione lyase family enzyme
MTAKLSRRDVLLSLPALAASARVFAQPPSPIRVTGINHVTLSVSDVKRSVDFYQGLFGMPIVSRQGETRGLRIGAGPQHLGISAAGSAAPNINHICLGVDGFDVDRITAALTARGFMKSDVAGNAGGGGLGGGPMTMRVRVRGPEAGGGRDGTPELYFSDADGIVMQLQDATYCSGSGRLGNVCAAVERSPGPGLMQLHGWSHCTVFAADGARANKFYEDLFGLKVQAFQGPNAPVYAVGGKGEFLMFAGGGAGRGRANAAPRMGSINHLCMNMDNFEPEKVIKALESYGIKPRGQAQGPAGPLVHYISLRMENRGGAKDGTPELYFTDPDGLLIQLQDTKYCGGAGVLGEICKA